MTLALLLDNSFNLINKSRNIILKPPVEITSKIKRIKSWEILGILKLKIFPTKITEQIKIILRETKEYDDLVPTYLEIPLY